MGWFLSGQKKLNDLPDASVIVRIKNHDAMRAIAQGDADRASIHALMDAFNMCEALVSMGIGADYKTEAFDGNIALKCIARRGLATGRFVGTGPELTAMNVAMELHDAQLDVAIISQLEKAMDIVARTKSSGRATKVSA